MTDKPASDMGLVVIGLLVVIASLVGYITRDDSPAPPDDGVTCSGQYGPTGQPDCS